MTHAHAHAHGHDGHDSEGPRPYFPAAEWQQFQKDDIKAGSAIIIEMASIFTIGLLLYTAVAFIVAGS
jgi:hypothetical protein